MKINNLLIVIRFMMIIFCTSCYLLLCLAFTFPNPEISSRSFISFIKYSILITGFVPWIFWIFFLSLQPNIRFFIYAILTVLFHYVVAAFAANSDTLIYWTLQITELSLLIPLWFMYKKLKRELLLN